MMWKPTLVQYSACRIQRTYNHIRLYSEVGDIFVQQQNSEFSYSIIFYVGSNANVEEFVCLFVYHKKLQNHLDFYPEVRNATKLRVRFLT